MDDWVSANHRGGLFAPIERMRMHHAVQRAISVAHTCLGISQAMCTAYARRYGRDFIPFQYSLDRARWGSVCKPDLTVHAPPELLYVGSIFRNAQLNSLIDCARAVAALNESGFTVKFRIATSPANGTNFGALLNVHPNVVVDTAVVDDDMFFRRLADTDALVLPVNFDRHSVDFIRYSMPTKVPAYLNSATPILAYGSLETAQMQYARDAHWGLMVTERSAAELQAAIKQILTDHELRQSLSEAASRAAENHDARLVREAFQNLLRASAA
jgi:glycosyltransferase involved in cell wall biosynthesis